MHSELLLLISFALHKQMILEEFLTNLAVVSNLCEMQWKKACFVTQTEKETDYSSANLLAWRLCFKKKNVKVKLNILFHQPEEPFLELKHVWSGSSIETFMFQEVPFETTGKMFTCIKQLGF